MDNSNIVYHDNEPATSRVEDEEREDVLEWFDDFAPVDYYAIQSKTFAKLAPDTTSWILRDPGFKAWMSNESGIFWGVGIPGSGKSFLTSFVINYLKEKLALHEKNGIVIFLYCRADDSITVYRALLAILRQLAEKSAEVFAYIRDKLYTPYLRSDKMPSEKRLILCIKNIVHRASSRVFIVIDALNELQDDVREKLLTILLSLDKPLFLTSRELSLPGIYAPTTRIQLPAQNFRSFVTHKLRQLPTVWALLEHRGEVLNELIEEVTRKSNGRFFLAVLQLSVLEGITSIKNLRKAVKDIPTKLADLYELIWKQLLAQREEESNLARRAILWATYAYRPLRLSELLEALVVESDATELEEDAYTSEKTLICVCRGLLVVEEEKGTVRLIHDTTYDFFQSYKIGLLKSPHSFAVTLCATYLHLSRFCDQQISNYYELEQFTASRPFAEYAVKYIGYHASLSASEGRGRIPQPAYDLISRSRLIPLSHPNMLTWSGMSLDHGGIVHFAALHGLLSILEDRLQYSNEGLDHVPSLLSHACIGGHAAIAKLLLDVKVEPQAQNIAGNNALHLASENGHEQVVQLLLKSPNFHVNMQNLSQKTALHLAARDGHERVVLSLLGTPGIDVNAVEEDRKTALHYGCAAGHDSVVRLLLESPGIDVNRQEAYYGTALHSASRNGHDSVVMLLLDYPGIDVNAQTRSKTTALHLACERGHERVVRLLLDFAGIDINVAEVESETTALHYASKNGYEVIVRLLLEHPEIDLNARRNEGVTPLHDAAENGHEAVVEMLLSRHETDINAQHSLGTALHLASSILGEFELVVRLLLDDPRIEVNIQNTTGNTALHYAAISGNAAITQMLLDSPKVDVNVRDEYGYTALHFAAEHGRNSVIRCLLNFPRATIKVNTWNDYGQTPLHSASSQGHTIAVQMLLGYSYIDVNAHSGEYGYTALHYASIGGYKPIIRLLLAVPSINVEARDTNGRTALDISSMPQQVD